MILGSILFQIQVDKAGIENVTRPILHGEFDVKICKDSFYDQRHIWFDTSTYKMVGDAFLLSDPKMKFYMQEI